MSELNYALKGGWYVAKLRLVVGPDLLKERVLTQSALAASSKEWWRLVSSEGMSVKDAAKALGIPANTASKVKRRIETMVAAVEAEFDDVCTHEKGQMK